MALPAFVDEDVDYFPDFADDGFGELFVGDIGVVGDAPDVVPGVFFVAADLFCNTSAIAEQQDEYAAIAEVFPPVGHLTDKQGGSRRDGRIH